MCLRWDRILDRLWLALSGAAVVAAALHLGAQLGLRHWVSGAGAAVLIARAAAPEAVVRTDGPGQGCRTDIAAQPR
ncbi:hypothetical protein ACRAWG_13030 [Methylobacterium sp. P31]